MYGCICVYVVCVCVHVSVYPKLLIVMPRCGVICSLYDWFKKFYNFYMAAEVSIASRYDLRIEACHRNNPNKSKLALHNLLFSL